MLLPAVLHPDVVDFLTLSKDNNLKENVGHCIFKLRQKQFDSGLRVKKLQGIAKRVWEARITKASRLIFTYEKSRQPHTGKRQTYIAIQDICLEHNDVSRRTRARKRTPDAKWLDAEEIEVIGSVERDRNSLSLEQQSALDTAQAEDLQILDDCVDELLGSIQWRVVESEEQWQRAIIKQDADLPLKLTPEEYELISFKGNLLLSGSAGTGKTTVGLYRLLKSLETVPTVKRLYVAYNPILVKEAQKHFRRLCGISITEIEPVFKFKTIQDLCLEILESGGQVYDPFNEVDYQIFDQLYRRPERQQYPSALVWDEIRSLIKGSQLATDINMLSQKEYERLGKKKAFLIPYNQRHIVYKLAEWYQKRLSQDGRFDEIDLARKALQTIKQGKSDRTSCIGKVERYQLIICDEVQDLTELQLELLVQLVADDGHLFFAGDLNQMISPSGFRWEDLKTRFFKSQRQAVQKTLNFNFRSVGCLVNLANQVLQLRSRLLKEPMSRSEQPVNSYGESARLIIAPIETLQHTLGELNPDDAIIVRSEVDKKRFSVDFQSSLVFTIEEAKGLEFDTVFLVEFFKENQNLWNKVFGGKQPLKETEVPQLRLEMNLLYVAVTRARRILNIWETQPSEVWNQVELASFVQLINARSVREQRVEPTPQMWRERGLYYQDAGFYRQAVECFEKAGDIQLQHKTLAKLFILERRFSEAAELFVELQDWQKAAQLFEKIKQWQKAAGYWQKTGNSDRQQICEVYALEAANEWENAAQQWEALKNFEQAKRCWLNSSNDNKKAEIRAVEFEHKEQWLKAAQQYESAGLFKEAAECRAKDFEKRKQWVQSAEQYELAGMLEKAEECRKKIKYSNHEVTILKTPHLKPQSNIRKLHFPTDSSMGKLKMSNRGGWTPDDVWQEIGEAQGDVSVPWNKKLQLEASRDASTDLSFLDALEPDDLYTIFKLTDVKDDKLAHLNRLTGLHSLDIRRSRISDAGLVHLQNLTSLIALGLSDTGVGDAGMKYLLDLKNLKRLFLSRTQVGNLGLTYLRNMVRLEDLNLMNTNVSDAGIEYIRTMSSLKKLILIGTRVSEVGWSNFQRALPRCEVLWMPHGISF